MRCSGLAPHRIEEDVVSDRTRLSRGDRNRNARLVRLRAALPPSNAVLGIDLADRVQALVLVDHESTVLARRKVTGAVWQLDAALLWATERAHAHGFTGVTVACEATSFHWRVVQQLTADAGMPLVCVPTVLVARGREQEDLAGSKSDDRDATVIARLAIDRRCYAPEPADEVWGRLRQLGNRRAQLVDRAVSCQHQLRDILDCAWPAVFEGPKEPLEAKTFRAALTVVLSRVDHGDLSRVRRLGRHRFLAAVRREMPNWGGSKPRRQVVDRVFDALSDPRGVHKLRAGLFERAELVLDDWRDIQRRLATIDVRMIGVLDELDLTELLVTIPGLSLIGAATLLAETGDLHRFSSGRAVVKHAGLAPVERSSGSYQGQTRLTGRGRARLRVSAWRVVWAAVHNNPVWAARHTHLMTREHNPLAPLQARAALAATMLRQLHAVVTRRVAWDPTIAAGTKKMPLAA
jgi:transposase